MSSPVRNEILTSDDENDDEISSCESVELQLNTEEELKEKTRQEILSKAKTA